MLLGFLAPVVVTLVLALWLGEGNWLTITLWIVAGVLAGLLLVLIILGRRAERAAYSQIDGQPGAVGAVLRSGLRGSWIGNEMPVAVNGKTQDAVYRAVGRGGVVLIGEGDDGRVERMLKDEERKVSRVLPNVPIRLLTVGHGEGSVELHRLSATLRKTKRSLTKPEVQAVSNRLNSLQSSLPIPKHRPDEGPRAARQDALTRSFPSRRHAASVHRFAGRMSRRRLRRSAASIGCAVATRE